MRRFSGLSIAFGSCSFKALIAARGEASGLFYLISCSYIALTAFGWTTTGYYAAWFAAVYLNLSLSFLPSNS